MLFLLLKRSSFSRQTDMLKFLMVSIYVFPAIFAVKFITSAVVFYMLLQWHLFFIAWYFALEWALQRLCLNTLCPEMFVFWFITIHTLAAFFDTFELRLLKKVQILSLNFFGFKFLSAEWAFITLLHPAINTFFTVCPFTIFTAAYHVFWRNTGANYADKLLHNPLVLWNSLIKH